MASATPRSRAMNLAPASGGALCREIPGAVGTRPGTHEALGMDAAVTLAGVLRRGLASGALVAQLVQRRPAIGKVQEVVFGCGVDVGCVGDGGLLFRRQLALARRGVGLGVA